MSTVRFYGDSERRNLRFARQLPRDGIPFADTADKNKETQSKRLAAIANATGES